MPITLKGDNCATGRRGRDFPIRWLAYRKCGQTGREVAGRRAGARLCLVAPRLAGACYAEADQEAKRRYGSVGFGRLSDDLQRSEHFRTVFHRCLLSTGKLFRRDVWYLMRRFLLLPR